MPNQIYPGDTFANGQQVDADRLNNHVGYSMLLPGCITEQPENAAITGTDVVPFVATSSNTLHKVKVQDLFYTNVPLKAESVLTGFVTAPAQSRLTLNAFSKTVTPGGVFNSVGSVLTVTLNGHDVAVGDTVILTTSNSTYNGTYRVSSTTTNTFNCDLNQTLPNASGIVSFFQRTAIVKTNADFAANTIVTNTITTANLTAIGTIKTPSLLIDGKVPMTTADNLTKTYEKSGTAIGAGGAGVENIVYQTPVLSVPSDETWIYQFTVHTTAGHVNGSTRSEYGSVSLRVYNNTNLITIMGGSSAPYGGHTASFTYAVSFTSADVSPKLILKTFTWHGFNEEPKYTILLTKVKTATLSDASSCI